MGSSRRRGSAGALHDVEGWKVADVADATSVGLPAATQRLRRGRMMLVTALAAGAERRLSPGTRL